MDDNFQENVTYCCEASKVVWKYYPAVRKKENILNILTKILVDTS